VNTEFFLHRRKAALSPICEFGILAARARSTENAAIAKSSVPPRGGKTGHSCKAQQDKSVELTDCGQSANSSRLLQGLLRRTVRQTVVFERSVLAQQTAAKPKPDPVVLRQAGYVHIYLF
jgi:hypothetical protein